MDHTSRPLTKRPRAALACNACRQTKSKCDSSRPSCQRCVSCRVECIYTQSGSDKRLDRQEERKSNLILRGRVKELEAQLAALTRHSQSPNSSVAFFRGSAETQQASIHSAHDGSPATGGSSGPPDNTTPDSTADALATGLLDQPPTPDIGYFGPSSNHAFFWSLTSSIESLGHHNTGRFESSVQGTHFARHHEHIFSQPPPPNAARQYYNISSTDDGIFPSRQTAIDWVRKFFDTIGAVLPVVNEMTILIEIDKLNEHNFASQIFSRSMRALLSMIFAYALCTNGEGSPEPFYKQALGLLDDKTLYMPNIESIQALVLMGSFQQNTQRAMESWTTNYLMVKAAYQVGIHAPATYQDYAVQVKEDRARLWLAVVNHDRILSCAIGRTCLIPPQHVQSEMLDTADSTRLQQGLEVSPMWQSSSYFVHVVSAHQIMGDAVNSVYNCNISSPKRLSFDELVSRTIALSSQLQKWRDDVGPLSLTSPNADFSNWPGSAFDTGRYEIQLSLYYYRTAMLINAALLSEMLESKTNVSRAGQASGVLHDTAISLLKTYLATLQTFLRLLCHILQQKPIFLKSNATWWLCNYMMFSISLHSFAFWLLANGSDEASSSFGMQSTNIKDLLRDSLETLKLVGGASIMSRKAHRCLHQYLCILTNTDSNVQIGLTLAQPQTSNMALNIPWDQLPFDTGFSSTFGIDMTSVTNELLGNFNEEQFLQADIFEFDQGISDFDATGFI